MRKFNNEEFDCLVNALTEYIRTLEEETKERMIETKIYFEESDEKLAKIITTKRIAEELKKEFIKEWQIEKYIKDFMHC